ncbi:MAG: NAD-dependent dihydropyrimidine dehydrogenase subunit PreA [Gammaproteobacteria bacterium]|nr:NAD-dependent dihydropyrimidine dehydrogenase subunit PreA [Gammaproteobacteria bacterium]MXW45853.1 NAD-dependent dihydropyrimidine dehydrogenase subunit PreA [Gammaproteobacteria bacterium]MYD00721.1 NAD-dependent dihydropyrimidine dehydrogenase subunit PreA [Gammaproteobacteria bacterium]MYI25491.1 NAD-dependent dihydropyrimidine dehydrogenase subunit PreA [Gammaproteobacteria bacterium]
MADLRINFCGIESPNPYWLASGPPTNSGEQVMRAFDAGWGGAVWKTLGDPIINVNSRFGAMDIGGASIAGFTNIELITDRPLAVNFEEMAAVKKRYPDRALIASLMVESRSEWREIIHRSEDAGCDGIELNFGCPHGMCERGMGSAVGQEPRVLAEITSWAREFSSIPVLVKLTPNVGDILEPGLAAVGSGADGLSLINTIKSVIGVDLERMTPLPAVSGEGTHGGYCGPAVKPIALHMVGALSRDSRIAAPLSAIGGVTTWRDAAEFIALGAASIQVCTAVMHKGYRIIEDLVEGLSEFLDANGMASVSELSGRATPNFREWGDLDLNYRVVADIDADACIGCQLCYTACLDGAHQCIHINQARCHAWHGEPDHGQGVRAQVATPVEHKAPAQSDARVPWVDEAECIGCNLCELVCPVPGCITMREVSEDARSESWNERVGEAAL